MFRVTGRVASIVYEKYGNWYLEDETGQIFIYGTKDRYGRYPYQSSWQSFGINVGDTITVLGPKSTYNGQAELVDATMLDPVTVMSDEIEYRSCEACDVTCHLYCRGEACEVVIPEAASSWLTLKSKTDGPDMTVTLHVADNKSVWRTAIVTFKTTVNGKEYTARMTVYQMPYMFTCKTVEGVEMSFVVNSDGERKTCAVSGTGQRPADYHQAIDTLTAGHVTIPGEANGYQVTYVDFYAFLNCRLLTSVTIPEVCTIINSYAFQGCTSLTDINFPAYVLDFGQDAFDGTPWFASQPDGVVYVNNLLFTYKGDMPENTAIKVKDDCTSISYGAFIRQQNLKSIALPANLDRIGAYAFAYSGIKQIAIPGKCSNVYTRAFIDCSDLEEVTLFGGPFLGSAVFSQCPKLEKIAVYSEVPADVNQNAFYYPALDRTGTSIYERATLCVPIGTESAYQNKAPWSQFSHIVGTEGLSGIATTGMQQRAEGPVYNLNGQCVGHAAKGVLISKGRKFVGK